jgi:site-specific recombinase XerD
MRRPEPWYRTSKGAWFVQFADKQIRLAKGPKDETEKAAFDAYYKLMAHRPENLPKGDEIQVAALCDLFLEYSKANHEPSTFRLLRLYLQGFCEWCGRLLARDVKPFHVTQWLDQHPTWKASRRHAALAVKRAFAWAEQQGILSGSPLRQLKVEKNNNPRTRVLTADERAAILAAIKDRQFREFVQALLDTGARPGEVARVTAADADLDRGMWVLEKHKSAKKTKKPRVIYLTPAMVELTRRLMAEHPEGPLFRGPRGGKPFTPNGIRCRFRRLREKLPKLKHFVAYSARHTWATLRDFLEWRRRQDHDAVLHRLDGCGTCYSVTRVTGFTSHHGRCTAWRITPTSGHLQSLSMRLPSVI